MLRILRQTCPPFQCTWTRRQVATSNCSPPPREVHCGAKQAVWMGEQKEREKSHPEWHHWIAKQTNPETSASRSFCYICQEVAMKAVEVGVLCIFWALIEKNGLGHQIGKHPTCVIPFGRVFFLWTVLSRWWISWPHLCQLLLIPPNFRAIELLKISECEDMKLIFT